MKSRIVERGQRVRAARGLLTGMSARWRLSTDSVVGRDMALVVALKGALIVALYLFIVRHAPQPLQDPAATAAAVAGTPTAPVHEVTR
jgi:ABC-type Fe3+-siderophore transport system permease subunit